MEKTKTKKIILTGLGLAVGMQIYDYFVEGGLNLVRFAFMILLCISILFLIERIRNR